MALDWQEILVRLLLGVALGAAIGIERQWRQKMAGLRTNALVALGAAGFVVFGAQFPSDNNPTHMAAQVVSGIGFLGAGIILREGINVHGLNTAATLWCSAMVGTFAGSGFFMASVAAATFVIITNLGLRPLVRFINSGMPAPAETEARYTVAVVCRAAEEAQARSLILQALTGAGLGLRRLDSADLPESAKVEVTAKTVLAKRNDTVLEGIVGRLSLEPFISGARWVADQGPIDS
jgi:putative Mg2+ transporter-C (MgtC) family protein